MSKTHTPGPYKIKSGRNYASEIVATSKRGKEFVIARMTAAKVGRDETEANAILIASAPDLLAACKAALAALSQPMTYPADIAAAKKWLTDAAAKAECRA